MMQAYFTEDAMEIMEAGGSLQGLWDRSSNERLVFHSQKGGGSKSFKRSVSPKGHLRPIKLYSFHLVYKK